MAAGGTTTAAEEKCDEFVRALFSFKPETQLDAEDAVAKLKVISGLLTGPDDRAMTGLFAWRAGGETPPVDAGGTLAHVAAELCPQNLIVPVLRALLSAMPALAAVSNSKKKTILDVVSARDIWTQTARTVERMLTAYELFKKQRVKVPTQGGASGGAGGGARGGAEGAAEETPDPIAQVVADRARLTAAGEDPDVLVSLRTNLAMSLEAVGEKREALELHLANLEQLRAVLSAATTAAAAGAVVTEAAAKECAVKGAKAILEVSSADRAKRTETCKRVKDAAEEVINTAPDNSAADALALCLRHVARLHIKCGKKKAGRSLNMEARDLENEVERRKTLARSRHAAAMGEEFERARHEEAKDEGDEGDRGEAGIEQAFKGFATLALGNSLMNEENDMCHSDDGSDDMWHSDDGSDDGSDGGGWNPEDGEDGG